MTYPGAVVEAEFRQLHLPLWPRATDAFTFGISRMSPERALQRRFIESNATGLQNLLVVDIDHPDAALRALSAHDHPMPTAVVENPLNGHAHAFWALSAPVARTEYAHRKPLVLCAAVVEGLRRSVDGDRAYGGLMMKNPVHASWLTTWMGSNVYDLPTLSEGLGTFMPPQGWRTSHATRPATTGLGRNCALFEESRLYAYRAAGKHFGHPERFGQAIHDYVATRNLEFPEPLPASEVRAIAASITRFVTGPRFYAKNADEYLAHLSRRQSQRGKKSGQVRKERSETLAKELIR